MLEQSNAAHYLPNELPVRFLITENICLFFFAIESYCNSSLVSKTAMNYGTAEGMRYYSEVGSKNKRRLRLTQGDQFSQVLIFTSKKKMTFRKHQLVQIDSF